MIEPQHPDILIRLMHFCASPDMFVREEISGGYVRDMLRDALDEIDRLRVAIRRLADQDATLSVQGGNVIVMMDATLTDAEREAVEVFAEMSWTFAAWSKVEQHADALRGLLERLGHQEGTGQQTGHKPLPKNIVA